MEGFKKASVQKKKSNQYPLHAIDGFWATEEKEQPTKEHLFLLWIIALRTFSYMQSFEFLFYFYFFVLCVAYCEGKIGRA